MASLRELQRSFAAALRDPAVACAVLPPANLAVYRNNASITFRETLERTFPVVRRRVGDDYFRQLCAQYRQKFPSRNADLHWAGRDFTPFLVEQLSGTDYAWLADLAQLEWLRTESAVSGEKPALTASVLAEIAAEDLERLVFGLQPSVRLHASSYPVFSVWMVNQVDNAPPVDHSAGSECGMIHQSHGAAQVRRLEGPVFSCLTSIILGATLGESVATAQLDERGVTQALAILFDEGLVSSMSLKKAEGGDIVLM
jgi:hypothetical protein